MIQLLRAIGDPALPPAVPRLAYGVWSVTAATMIRGIALTSVAVTASVPRSTSQITRPK
jgi:hypothetical protein